MADERFRGMRLEIATVLNGRWRTLYQTARALGRRSGDIQKSLRQMHAEGVLMSEDEKPEPGTRYRLADGLEGPLAEALRADQIPGLLEAEQDLLILSAPSRTALNAVFARGDLAAVTSWAARLGDGTTMLLAVAPRATEADYGRLLTVLEADGIQVGSHRAAAVFDGRALRANSIAAAEAAVVAAGDEA